MVFNDGLAARHQTHEAGQPYLTDAELSARLTAAKATSERAWLNEVSAVVLQQALADLNTAYRNYFGSLTGTRKGPKAGPPRFRSRKDTRQGIRFTANARFKVLASGKLRLPRIGDVPVRWSRAGLRGTVPGGWAGRGVGPGQRFWRARRDRGRDRRGDGRVRAQTEPGRPDN